MTVIHSEQDMQQVMDIFSDTCNTFSLTISLTKTKVMYCPVLGAVYEEPNIFVNPFVHFDSTLFKDGSLDKEMYERIYKAICHFW